MGWLDALTGKPAKRAAEANRQAYTANKAEGLGYLDTGKQEGMGYLDQAIGAFDPLISLTGALGAKYGAGTDMYLDAMGVNGPEGTARAQAAFQQGPGYQFAVDQGQKALARMTSAGGTPAGGQAMMAAQKYGVGMANQEYGNWLKNFQNFINPELAAMQGMQNAATGQAQGYTNQAQLTASDATNRVNLGNTTTSGIAGANNAEAQAKMQASGNLLNFGMNLAKMATGLPGFGGQNIDYSRNSG